MKPLIPNLLLLSRLCSSGSISAQIQAEQSVRRVPPVPVVLGLIRMFKSNRQLRQSSEAIATVSTGPNRRKRPVSGPMARPKKKISCDSRFRPPVFPRETWLLGRRGLRKVVVHEGGNGGASRPRRALRGVRARPARHRGARLRRPNPVGNHPGSVSRVS